MIEHNLDMRGMRRRELFDYFINIGGEDKGNGLIVGDDFKAIIGDEEFLKLGSIKIPATKIILSISQDKCDDILESFRLKFLTAGG